ncbi:DNA repair protein rad16 [Amphichorda felina]
MPRGRPSLRSNATLASASTDSVEVPSSGTGRLTRSSSSKDIAGASIADPSVVQNEMEFPIARLRGRPRKSHQSDSAPSPAASSSAASLGSAPSRRGPGRPHKLAPAGSESVSSVHTPIDATSGSEYSTPATSKFPTPVATDVPGSSKLLDANSLEVQLPARGLGRERALRGSKYSMNSSVPTKDVIGDSEEDDDLLDFSPDAVVARRLQREENKKAAPSQTPKSLFQQESHVPGSRSSSSLATGPRKRGRASTASTTKVGRPSKMPKFIPDSEDDVDMDQEYARKLQVEEYTRYDEGKGVEDDKAFVAASSDSDDLDEDFEPYKPTRARTQLRQTANSTAVPDDYHSDGFIEEIERTELGSGGLETSSISSISAVLSSAATSDSDTSALGAGAVERLAERRRAYRRPGSTRRVRKERDRLELHHPEIKTMWDDLEKMPVLKAGRADQPRTISRQLKPFQLEGLAWMKAMEQTEWKGGLLGDEMGLGKTIQAVSLIMSDYPAKQPSLVLVPPVALMQWQSEIKSYTDGTLNTFVYHGTNQKAKSMTIKDLKKYDVIMMSYNSLESMYRKQEKGFKRKDAIHKEQSVIHSIQFHRVILDEAHSIKTRSTMTAKACFALQTDYRWCLTGTPLQNRIGEFFSLIRFLNVRPFASYLCKQCPCSTLEWTMDEDKRCSQCNHAGMQHVSVFNQELLNPIQKYGNLGPGREAFKKLRMMTDRIMLRRLKKDHTNSMELPVKEVYVDRQFFGEEENDFANSIMTSGQRKFDTYVAQGVLLNNYANIFGLIMQMRQVADHPDLILKKNAEGGQNVLVCCICDEPAEDTVRSRCKHEFCRTCVASYVRSTDTPDCPRCHIPLSIDLEQPEIEQDENRVKKSSIINRIKMENWTSSSKIELLVHELHKLRSDNATHKSIIFSQFTTMLQLIEWRLRRAGITTVMLDGSMTPAQRQASIEHFMNNVDVECFLVSLKAGGVALNLTEASRVFIVDPWWNPAAEWQSADRCHRIGQTRPCTITRLCIEDSVESRMVLIQEKKTSMIHSTVNADDKAMESLSPADMQFLFRGT